MIGLAEEVTREVCQAHGRLFFLRLELSLMSNATLVVPTPTGRARREQLRAEIDQMCAEIEGEPYFSRD